MTVGRDPLWVRGSRRVAEWAAVIAGALVLVMVLNVVVDVTARDLWGRPLQGTTELTSLIYLPCSAVLPLAFVHLADRHIRVDPLIKALGSTWIGRVVGLIGELICLAVGIWVAYLTWQEAQASFALDERGLIAEWIRVWVGRGFVAIGWALFGLSILVRIRDVVRGNVPEENTPGGEMTKVELENIHEPR